MTSVLPVHLSLCGFLQAVLLYGKLSDGLYSVPYSFIFCPSMIGLGLELGRELLDLLNRSKLSKTQALSTVVYLVSLSCILCSVFFLAEMLDWDSDSVTGVFIPIFFVLAMHLTISLYQSTSLRYALALGLNFVTPALNVCTMSGGCSSFYASTLTSLLSAFGITVLDLTHILVPVTLCLLSATLYSIYYTQRKLTYPPLLIASTGAFLILMSHVVTGDGVSLYSGNIALVAGVLWNNKLIKETFN